VPLGAAKPAVPTFQIDRELRSYPPQ